MRPSNSPHAFRIVRLTDELQQELGLPRLICADPEGLPFPEGQTFRAWLVEENACQSATADKYLTILLPFLTYLWLRSPRVHFTAPADQIRQHVRDYLRDKLGCGVRPHPSGNFIVTVPKIVTQASVRFYLVALRRFYDCAILKGWYTDVNPLLWRKPLVATAREFTPHMPPASGLTLPEQKRGRMPETYFCLVTGEWQPQIIDDPLLPGRLLAGFTYRRDQLITRILFQSGARVSEVLGLTLRDWRSRGLRERALAMSKGSSGERVKEIWWSSETAQLLRRYVETERRQCDATGRGLDDLPDAAPLFLTHAGDAYRYAAFYFHWRRACARAGLQVHPHQTRHWFVTMALRYFQAMPEADQREAQRQGLISYMSWKNPETLRAYDHHLRRTEFAATHAALMQLVEGPLADTTAGPPEVARPARPGDLPADMVERLNRLLDSQEGPDDPR